MRTKKKKNVEQKKTETARNPWSQSGWWVWVSTVEKIFGKICFSLEWESDGVMDDDSGDNKEDEGEEFRLLFLPVCHIACMVNNSAIVEVADDKERFLSFSLHDRRF